MHTIKLLLTRNGGFGRNSNKIMCIPEKNIYTSKCLHRNVINSQRPAASQYMSNKKQSEDILKEITKLRNHLLYISQNTNLPRLTGNSASKIFSLIECCVQNLLCYTLSQRNSIANDLRNLLDNSGNLINVSHYNELLEMYLRNECTFLPMQFLKEMNSRGVQPNSVTYEKLVEYYAWQGDIKGAIGILKLMKDKDHAMNENIFNLLIFGHAKSRDIEGALKVVDTMVKNNLCLSINTYSALMCAYASNNDVVEIERIIESCKEKHLNMRNLDILKVIYILAQNNYMEHIGKMSNYLVSDNSITINELQVLIKLIDLQERLAISLFLKLYKNENTKDHLHLLQLFVTALITREAKPDDIINFCMEIETSKDQRIFLPAVYSSFQQEDIDLTLNLLRCCTKLHYIIKPHFFWPLLVKTGAKFNFHGILNILDIMVKDFNVVPCFYTIKDYVIPHAFNDVNKTRFLLHKCNIPMDIINNAVLYSLLKSGKTIKAAEYMCSFPGIYWSHYLSTEVRLSTYARTDAQSFIEISTNLCKGIPTFSGSSGRKVKSSMEDELLHFIHCSSNFKPFLAQIILLLDTKTCISPKAKNMLINYLQDLADTEVVSALEQFSSNFKKEEFSSANRSHTRKVMSAMHEYVHQAEDNLQSLKNGLSSSVQNELGETPNTTSHMHRKKDNLERLKDAFSLVEENKLDDACNYLTENPISAKGKHTQIYIESMFSKENSLLSNLKAEELTKLFNSLLSTKYMQLTFSVVSYWVNAYIQENNFERAIEIYCSKTDDKFIPFAVKHRLIKALITKKDHILLQKLVDHCVKIESKPVLLMDLFFSFLECGETEEAMKVVEHDEFTANLSTLNFYIKKYVDSNDDLMLRKFLDITQGIEKIRRVDVYDSLIQSYAFKNNWSSALELWNRMQNENLSLNDNTLEVLSDVLRKNNQPVPFEYSVKNMENDSVQ